MSHKYFSVAEALLNLMHYLAVPLPESESKKTVKSILPRTVSPNFLIGKVQKLWAETTVNLA